MPYQRHDKDGNAVTAIASYARHDKDGNSVALSKYVRHDKDGNTMGARDEFQRRDSSNTLDSPQPESRTFVDDFGNTYKNYNADYEARDKDGNLLNDYESVFYRSKLDLDFAGNKSLIDAVSGNNLITFSRASIATYVGADGLIKTAAADEARFDHDSDIHESLGLLIEESRTNRLPYSERFDQWTIGGASTVTPNAVVAPDGTLTADRVLMSQSGGGSQINQPNVVQSGVTYTASVWAKAVTPGSENNFRIIIGGRQSSTFTATGEWQRFTLTGSTGTPGILQLKNPNSGTAAADIYFWGAQLEPGSFVTSYIPTDGSAVTRAADIAEIADVSSFYNQTEGAFFTQTGVGGISNTTVDTARTFIYTGSGIDGHWLEYRNVLDQLNARTRVGGDPYYGSNATLTPVNYLNDKLAVSYSATGGAAVMSGTIRTTSLEFTPTINAIYIGGKGSGTNQLNGHIKRLAYFNTRLSDTILQTITA